MQLVDMIGPNPIFYGFESHLEHYREIQVRVLVCHEDDTWSKEQNARYVTRQMIAG